MLLPLHLEYAPDNLARSSMLRAGLSVTGSEAERKWLWVHVVLVRSPFIRPCTLGRASLNNA